MNQYFIASHIIFQSNENIKNRNSFITQYKNELKKLVKSHKAILDDVNKLRNLFMITSKLMSGISYKDLEKKLNVVEKIDEDLRVAKNLLVQSERFNDETLNKSINELIDNLRNSKKQVDSIIRKSAKSSKPKILTDKNEITKFFVNTVNRSINIYKGKKPILGKDYFTSTKSKDGKIKFLRVFPVANLGDFKKCFLVLYATLSEKTDDFSPTNLVFCRNNPVGNSTGGYVLKNKKDVTNSLKHLGYEYSLPIFNNLIKINPNIKIDRRSDKFRALNKDEVKFKIINNQLKIAVPTNSKINFADIFLDVKDLLNVSGKDSGLKYTSKNKGNKIIYTFTLIPKVEKELNENTILETVRKL